MKNLAVVIPYFQRDPGLLRRAVESILSQDVGPDVTVEVLIADDESPTPPEQEIEGLSRPGFEVRILKRPNGGPAKARNTALEAAQDPDYVAFLDSDDWWEPDHLSTALGALQRGAGFYFANNHSEPGKTWFQSIRNGKELIAKATPDGKGCHTMANDVFLSLFLADCVAHTSSVVFDARQAPGMRFDDAQSHGGEDYLFWLDVVRLTRNSAFSATPKAHRGRGIDLCRSAYDWSNPFCARRLYLDLVFRKKLIREYCQTESQRQQMAELAGEIRRELLQVLARNTFAHFQTSAPIWWKLILNDPVFFAYLPHNAIGVVARKLAGPRKASLQTD
ncbi:MAG: glycosyltransferase family 2 protein [Hyphomonas sp.]